MEPITNYFDKEKIIKQYAIKRASRTKGWTDHRKSQDGRIGIMEKNELGMIGEAEHYDLFELDWKKKLIEDSKDTDGGFDFHMGSLLFDIKARELTFRPEYYYPQLFQEEWDWIFYDYKKKFGHRPDGLIFVAVYPGAVEKTSIQDKDVVHLGWISLLDFLSKAQFKKKGEKHPCGKFNVQEDTIVLPRPARMMLNPILTLNDLANKISKKG